jgi:hypothetical protein
MEHWCPLNPENCLETPVKAENLCKIRMPWSRFKGCLKNFFSRFMFGPCAGPPLSIASGGRRLWLTWDRHHEIGFYSVCQLRHSATNLNLGRRKFYRILPPCNAHLADLHLQEALETSISQQVIHGRLGGSLCKSRVPPVSSFLSRIALQPSLKSLLPLCFSPNVT